MGSFSFTCAISNLPIEAGTPVRFLLLTESQYPDEFTGRYQLRTYPLRGEYDNYGSVRDVQEGAQRDIWLEAFKYDLIERGRGNNRVHDVPVKARMSFDELLEVVQERRLVVRPADGLSTSALLREETVAAQQDALTGAARQDRAERPKPEDQRERYYPTVQSVADRIRAAGLRYYEDDPTKEGYVLDEEGGYRRGSIRVRWSGYGECTDKLQALQSVLASDFATMITCGSGNYASSEEMLVRPLPRPQEYVSLTKDLGDGGNQELAVKMAMIREDVWQACVVLGKDENRSRRGTLDYRGTDLVTLMQNSSAKPTYDMFSVGLETHWNLMWLKAKESLVSGDEVKDFLQTAEELQAVVVALALTRYVWRPSYSGGPQFGEFRLHAAMLERFAKIASDEDAAIERRRQEDDDKSKKWMQENGYRLYTEKADFYRRALEELKLPKYDDAVLWLHDYDQEVYRSSPSHTLNGLHWGYPDSLAIDVLGEIPSLLSGGGRYAQFVKARNENVAENNRYSKVPYAKVKSTILLGLEQKRDAALAEAEKYPKPRSP